MFSSCTPQSQGYTPVETATATEMVTPLPTTVPLSAEEAQFARRKCKKYE